jgi:hypothetical protein
MAKFDRFMHGLGTRALHAQRDVSSGRIELIRDHRLTVFMTWLKKSTCARDLDIPNAVW